MDSEKKNDIALVRVSRRIWFSDSIKPACLHVDIGDESSNAKLIATGWDIATPECKRQFRIHIGDDLISLFFS